MTTGLNDELISRLNDPNLWKKDELEYIDPLCKEAAKALESEDAEVTELCLEVMRLREALQFYADVSKYPAPLTGGMGALWSDCGSVARIALGDGR